MRMKPKPWDEFKEELFRLYRPPKRSPETFRAMCRALNQLEAVGPIESTADLTTGLIDALIESRPAGQSPATLATLLSHVRAICNHAKKSRWLEVSPFSIRFHDGRLNALARPGRPAKKRHLTREEIRKVLEKAAEEARESWGWARWKACRLQALTATVAYCGLRTSEALNLRVGDLHLDLGYIDLEATDRGRRGRPYCVPIPDALAYKLFDWLDHRLDAPPGFEVPADVPWLIPNVTRTGPWRSGSPGTKPVDCVKDLGRRAGVPGLTLQSLRCSLAIHLEHHGLDEDRIAQVLGTLPANADVSLSASLQITFAQLVRKVADFDFTERAPQ